LKESVLEELQASTVAMESAWQGLRLMLGQVVTINHLEMDKDQASFVAFEAARPLYSRKQQELAQMTEETIRITEESDLLREHLDSISGQLSAAADFIKVADIPDKDEKLSQLQKLYLDAMIRFDNSLDGQLNDLNVKIQRLTLDAQTASGAAAREKRTMETDLHLGFIYPSV
jgi:hypothetical protein